MAFEYDTTALQCFACADRERTADARRQSDNADNAGIYYAVKHREEHEHG